MDKMILSTKNYKGAKKHLILQSAIAIFIIIGIWCLALIFWGIAEDLSDSTAAAYALMFSIVAVAVTVLEIISAKKNIYSLCSYIDIYDDYIEGAGMQGFNYIPFRLENKHIISVAANGNLIILGTTIGIFTIKSNIKTAEKVYEHFNIK